MDGAQAQHQLYSQWPTPKQLESIEYICTLLGQPPTPQQLHLYLSPAYGTHKFININGMKARVVRGVDNPPLPALQEKYIPVIRKQIDEDIAEDKNTHKLTTAAVASVSQSRIWQAQTYQHQRYKSPCRSRSRQPPTTSIARKIHPSHPQTN